MPAAALIKAEFGQNMVLTHALHDMEVQMCSSVLLTDSEDDKNLQYLQNTFASMGYTHTDATEIWTGLVGKRLLSLQLHGP